MPRLRVLLADDEPSIREILGAHLQQEGHLVEFASDGQEALEKLQDFHFDLIVSDENMPRIKGTRLAALNFNRKTPFILITGVERSGEDPLGVTVVLPKPFRMEAFRQAVNEATSNRVM